MECTVRKSADGNESRLLEMEKLQRLVQTLQQQNEQLMAAAGSQGVQNGDRQRKATAAGDPPRDSGIDLSASCSDDLEDDILDLDRFDMPDDEESWLYSTPAAKSQGDVLSWLRKDISSLDPASRRALAIKLELLIARKHNDGSKVTSGDSKSRPGESKMAQGGPTTPISLIGILDFDEEGVLSMEPTLGAESFLSPESESGRVISRRTTFRVERKSTEAAAAAAAAANGSGASTATYSRAKKVSLAPAAAAKGPSVTPMNNGPKQLRQQQLAVAPALTVTDDTVGTVASASVSPGRKFTSDVIEAIHPELNPDMHDIQLLASLQEEELRRCLQNLQQLNRRRRTSSGNQKEGDSSPVTPQSNASSGTNAAPTPVIAAKVSDRYATYTKPKQQQLVASNGVGGAADISAAAKPGAISSRKVASSTVPSQPLQAPLNQDAVMSAQRVTGLQKSLPNLSGSRSEFNLPAPSFPVDTASEKGSYGDIPSALNPPSRGQAASSTPRLAGPGSRLPTPARSRLPTPAKSGIPTPRTGPSLPVPMSSSRQRMRSPGTKPSFVNTSKSQSGKESWKEGCF